MKYFNGVRSLKDVKAKYRELSLKYHPDRGGDEDIMKEVNNEYAQLYAVYKNKRNDDWSISDDNMADATETAQSWAGNWYAENGWTGSRYTGYMRGADITKIIRDYAKQKWPQFKFSVTLETYSGGRSIYVSLIGSPYPLNADGTNENRYGSNFYHTRMWKDTEGMNERVRVAFCDVVEYMDSYNYDHSDSMEDYFDVNFYTHISVGTSKRPYEQTNTLSGGAAFKWKDGPAHKALKKALGGGGAMFKEYSMRRGTFVLYGEMHYYSEEPHFYPKEYSQPSVIKRVMERMTECGLIVKQCGSAIEFVGYTPEMERALAEEDREREAV